MYDIGLLLEEIYSNRKNLIIHITIITVIIIAIVAYKSKTIDTERITGYVEEVWYYEDWNEYIQKTCTKNVDDKLVTYDCSYIEYHPEYYEVKTTIGTYNISEEKYIELVAQFKNKVFVDMYRNYHNNDGDAYKTIKTDIVPVTKSHWFVNKTLLDNTLYHYDLKEDPKSLGLYEWPQVNLFNDPCILGYNDSKASLELAKINAIEGANKQIRIWLLVYNKPYSVFEAQRYYWRNGKKNELVICVGLNGERVIWANGFCWNPNGYAGNDALIINCRDAIMKMNKFDASKTVDIIRDNLHLWKRKPFSEFDYIQDTSMIEYILFSLLITVTATPFVLKPKPCVQYCKSLYSDLRLYLSRRFRINF